jgi:hypothetical protein
LFAKRAWYLQHRDFVRLVSHSCLHDKIQRRGATVMSDCCTAQRFVDGRKEKKRKKASLWYLVALHDFFFAL